MSEPANASMTFGGWPALGSGSWPETRRTLHMWTQIVGKSKLALSPFQNHWWQVGLTLNGRGLTTGLIPLKGRSLEVLLDFVSHELVCQTTDGHRVVHPLLGQSVATFAEDFHRALTELGVDVVMSATPSELKDPVPFAEDTAPGSYDREAVHAWWSAMVSTERVMQRFRSTFVGKTSPVYFYWGSFDLTMARFSGRRNPHPGPGIIRRHGESHEYFAVGFWPGDGPVPLPTFYGYMTPSPAAAETVPLQPEGASWSSEMGEYLLPYEAVRSAEAPDDALFAFMTSAYDGAATLASWNREALEEDPPAGAEPPHEAP